MSQFQRNSFHSFYYSLFLKSTFSVNIFTFFGVQPIFCDLDWQFLCKLQQIASPSFNFISSIYAQILQTENKKTVDTIDMVKRFCLSYFHWYFTRALTYEGRNTCPPHTHISAVHISYECLLSPFVLNTYVSSARLFFACVRHK